MKHRAVQLSQLASIIDEVHDYYFSLEDLLTQVGDTREFQLYRRSSHFAKDLPFRKLTVNGVNNLKVEDTERISYYDINELIYEHGVLTISTGVPLLLQLMVDKLDVEVEDL